MCRALSIALLFGGSLLMAAAKPDETFGMKNGRFWNNLPSDDSTRSILLVGILDGWTLRSHTEEAELGKVIHALSSGGNFTTNDLADMVSSVFADTENITLPIGWVAMGCLAVQRGETTRGAVSLALRRHLAEMSKGRHVGNEIDPIDVIIRSQPK